MLLKENEREILTCMRKFEREGLDGVSQLVRSLEKKNEREFKF
jgi:hypothetical protein